MKAQGRIAQRLFEMTQEYLPYNDKRKVCTWQELPDEAKNAWHNKATGIIMIMEEYCPFSQRYNSQI